MRRLRLNRLPHHGHVVAPQSGPGLIGAAFSVGFVLGPMMDGLLGELSPRAPFRAAAAMSGAAFLYGWVVARQAGRAESASKA